MSINKEILDKVSAGDLEGAAAAVCSLLDKKRDQIVKEGSDFLANSLFGDCADQFSSRPAATTPPDDGSTQV